MDPVIAQFLDDVQTDEALAAVDRVILELSIDHTYGASYLEAKT